MSRRPNKHRRPSRDAFGSWLERSIDRPVYIDRSDGEKIAEELFIYEKAKTEKWNRWLSRVWFSVKIGFPIAIIFFFLGMATAVQWR